MPLPCVRKHKKAPIGEPFYLHSEIYKYPHKNALLFQESVFSHDLSLSMILSMNEELFPL